MYGIFNKRGIYSRKYFPTVFKSKYEKGSYECWRGGLLAYGLNGVCKEIYDSYMKVVNEFMSAIHFWAMYN